MKRLNDTAAIAAEPADNLQKHESRTTSVSKIDNGYIVRESSSKDGEYECREYYSKDQPQLGEDKGETSMKKAVDYMKRNGTL